MEVNDLETMHRRFHPRGTYFFRSVLRVEWTHNVDLIVFIWVDPLINIDDVICVVDAESERIGILLLEHGK